MLVIKRLSAGDLAARASAQLGEDEWDRLAVSFNEMAEALERRFADAAATQAALACSEKLFRDLFEFSPTAIFVEDENGTVLDANTAACRLHKLGRAQLVGKNVADLVPALSRGKVARSFPGWLSGELAVAEGETRSQDGQVIPVEIRGCRIEYGRRQAVLLHVIDISARRQAEIDLRSAHHDLDARVVERTAQLAAANEKLRVEAAGHREAELATRELHRFLDSIVENIPNMVFVKDAESLRFVRINKAGEELLGFARAELIGKNDFDFFPSDEASFFTAKDRAVLESGQLLDIPREDLQTRDKGVRQLHTRKIPIFDGETGRPKYLLGISEDITERIRAEEAARWSEERLRAVIANVPAILFSTDTEGVITLEEGRGLQALNRKPGSVVGRSVFELYRDVPVIGESVRRALDGAIFSTMIEVENMTFEATFSPLHDASDVVIGVTGVAHDITERRHAQRELEHAAAELRRSNEELEQFAYVASHDLQEPLRMVASYTQLLQRRYADQLDGTANEFIEFAVDGAERMQHFINDLLHYSRVGTQRRAFERVELGAVFETALKNLTVSIQETGASVAADLLPAVRGDERQLLQVFQNLIGNAIKFHKPGEPPRVRVSAQREQSEDGPCWRIDVADNGIGIDPQFFDRVFAIFQRLHSREEYSGTGIGLAICKKIVERHGGRIWVTSGGGSGSVFSFTLPADDPETSRPN